MPSVAIIVPVFNDLKELKGLLNALRAESVGATAFELIVVDDGSWDGTGDYVAANRKSFPFPIRLLRQANRGPGAARNYGVRDSTAEVVVFIDADARPRPGWLQAITDALLRPGVGAVGGAEAVRADASTVERAAAYVMTSFLTTGGMRGAKHSVTRYFPRSFNMAARRQAFDEAQGFPDAFDAEDLVFSARVRRAGYTLAFEPRAITEHRRETSARELFTRVRRMARGRIYAAAEYPELLDIIVMAQPLVVVGGAALGLVAPGIVGAYLALTAAHAASTGVGVRPAILVPGLFAVQQLAYFAGVLDACRGVAAARRPQAHRPVEAGLAAESGA